MNRIRTLAELLAADAADAPAPAPVVCKGRSHGATAAPATRKMNGWPLCATCYDAILRAMSGTPYPSPRPKAGEPRYDDSWTQRHNDEARSL